MARRIASALAFLFAGLLAVFAQGLLDASPWEAPDPRAFGVYAGALALFLWALRQEPAWLEGERPSVSTPSPSPSGRPFWAVLSLGLAALAFLESGGNRFRLPGVIAWGLAVAAWLAAWWDAPLPRWPREGLRVHGWHLLLLLVLGLGIGFRYWDLWNLPLDVNSDHAEKLLDVRTS
jgi:hypothetical protein